MEILFDDDSLRITRLVVGPLENNVYVVSCTRTREAVIVDAAAEPDRILAAVRGFTVLAVLTTHGHHDHIGAAAQVTEKLGVPFRLHVADSVIAGMESPEPVNDGDEVVVGDVSLTAIHTPGHTPGSTTFATGKHLFTGDTLFPGGPGATRFPYSDFDTIMRSLDERLFPLSDSTIVYPGHGATTTLGAERPHVEEWRSRRW